MSERPIIIVANEFPPVQGGIATLTADYARFIAKQHPVWILLIGPQSGEGIDLPENVQCQHLQGASNRKICQSIMQKNGQHVLFNHYQCANSGLLIRLRTAGIGTSCLLHGMDMCSNPPLRIRLRRSGFNLRIRRWILMNLFHCLIANSRFTEKVAHRVFPGVRTCVVNPGIWLNELPVERRSEFNGKHSIVSVGRLIKRKGVDTLLRALALTPDIPAIIIGDGPDREEFELLSRDLGLEHRVTFLGGMSHRETLEEIRKHTIFCLLPRVMPEGDVEGFGIVFLEASATGLVVIAGNSGGVSDAVSDQVSGFLVDPESPEMVASKLECIAAEPRLFENIREQSISWIHQFDWDRRDIRRELACLYS